MVVEDLIYLRKKVTKLVDENLRLSTENAYLKGEVKAYEYFLQSKSYTNGDEE